MKQLNKIFNIVVCPKSMIEAWKNHFNMHYNMYFTIIDGTKTTNTQDFINKSIECNACPTVLILNYDLVWRRPNLLKYKDYTLILDESQFIKNSTSKRSKFISKMNFTNLILLSGTPIRWKIRRVIYSSKLVRLEGYKETLL